MQNKAFASEKYPLIIQVIDHLLMVYSPDFEYRVAEPYRPTDVGQTEMMIMKVRREISAKLSHFSRENTTLPSPTRSKDLIPDLKDDMLSIKEVARILGYSQDTVRRMADRKELRFTNTPGGHRRFARSHIEAIRPAPILKIDAVPYAHPSAGKETAFPTELDENRNSLAV